MASGRLNAIFFGIEHEVAFLNKEDKFADFSRTTFDHFNQIIEKLPYYPQDYPHLRIGDAGIKVKRWYIEGFERFKDSEKPIDCVPKGIEIGTTIHSSIQDTLSELTESFRLLTDMAHSIVKCRHRLRHYRENVEHPLID